MAETMEVTLTGEPVQKPYEDEQLLRSLCEHDYTLREMAEVCECSAPTVLHYVRQYGITTGAEQSGGPSCSPVPFRTRRDGYEYWKEEQRTVLVHRLVAVAEWGFEAVADSIVHHETVPWDNRPSQLRLFETHGAHMRYHARPVVDEAQATLAEFSADRPEEQFEPSSGVPEQASLIGSRQLTLDECALAE